MLSDDQERAATAILKIFETASRRVTIGRQPGAFG